MADRQVPAYRRDIDGLRAIAVISVVVFHYFPELLGGGFTGVDIFFVISGYLISGIIFDGLEKNRFSFRHFYARRIQRIFPALLLVLCTTLVLGWLLLFPDELRALGKHAAAGALFLSNVLLWREAGYFDVAATAKPLLHLWSLGVEEQFYLVWPPFLLLMHKWPRHTLRAIVIVMLLSFAANILFVIAKPTATFYLPVSRLWELALGAALAYVDLFKGGLIAQASRVFRPGKPGGDAAVGLQNGFSAIGIALLALSFALIDEQRAFPGFWALLPTLGAFFVIASGPAVWLNRRILGHPGLVYIGLISYPLYLWHWPLLTLYKMARFEPPGWQERIALILASLLLAALTYHLVERPIRFGARRANMPAALAALMLAVGTFGVLLASGTVASNANRDRDDYVDFFVNSSPQSAYSVRNGLEALSRDNCNFYDRQTNGPKETISPDCSLKRGAKSVFLWGDSHAKHLYPGLSRSVPDTYTILQVTTSACPPGLNDVFPDSFRSCNRSNRYALREIEATKPDVVILAQQHFHERTDWDQLALRLKSLGARHVLLVGPVPQWKPDLHKVIAKAYWTNTPERIATNHDRSIEATDRYLKSRYANSPNLAYISLIDRLCNQEGCIAYLQQNRKEGIFTYDYGHLTPLSSLYVARHVLAPVLAGLEN